MIRVREALRGIRTLALVLALALTLLAGLAEGAAAQASSEGAAGHAARDTAEGRPPRVGLALSGGSARGFAHIGVLLELRAAGIPVDALAGTSMGAVIGGLHASGHTPERLATLARELDWSSLFRDAEPSRPPWPRMPARTERHQLSLPLRDGRPGLPSGLIEGQRITMLLARLTWETHPVSDYTRLPIPFTAVATDLETGRPVPLTDGYLPLSIRASLAIPSLFTPVRLGDRTLVDGAVSRNLPASDVRALGAEHVVCSDVTEGPKAADSLRTFLDVLEQTLSFQIEREAARQRELCDVVLRPRLEELGTYSFDRAPEWIERGRQAVREELPDLRALVPASADRADPSPVPTDAPRVGAGPDSVFLVDIRAPGLPHERVRFLRRVLGLSVPGRTTVDLVDRRVEDLFDAGWFSRIVYRLEDASQSSSGRPPEAGDGELPRRVLVLLGSAGGRDRLHGGLRFDSHYNASALLTAEFPQLLSFGSTTEVEARLGEALAFEARHWLRPSFAPGFLAAARAGYRRLPVDLFDPVGRELPGDLAAEAGGLTLFMGRVLGRIGVAGLELTSEGYGEDPVDGSDAPRRTGVLTTLAATVRLDSRDREVFPTRGLRLEGRLEASQSGLGGDRDLVQSWSDLEAHLPVGDRWTLSARATVGSTGGDDPPLHRTFHLGSTLHDYIFPHRQLTFPGIPPQRFSGRHLQRLETGVRARVRERGVLEVRWVGGDVLEAWTLRPSDWTYGMALSAGVLTPLGPIRLTLSDATADGGPRLELDAGGRF